MQQLPRNIFYSSLGYHLSRRTQLQLESLYALIRNSQSFAQKTGAFIC